MDDSRRILMQVIGEMREHTSPSLSQICGARAEDTGELVGSGTIVDVRGRPFLLTAEHVARTLFAQNSDGSRRFPVGLCHSVGSGQRMMRIAFPWVTWPAPKDIAVTRIDPVVLEGTEVVPLSAARFARSTDELNNEDVYFIQGWPGAQSRFTAFFERGVVSTSQPYGGWLTEETIWSDFDRKTHFAITYPMTGLIDERGHDGVLPLPGGMSGSVIWKSNRKETGPAWSPDLATVVGLAHRFDPDKQCLIATRIEYVKGLLLDVVRSEYAYQRWSDRGRPMGDDWADWFAAESEITRL